MDLPHLTLHSVCCQLAVCRCFQNGQIPKLSALEVDSDSEEEPDAVIHVPINKVKLVVGPGGEKIKHIQRKSKCRLQVNVTDCGSHALMHMPH